MNAAPLPIESWAGDLARHCAAKLAQAISATGLVMDRSWFGQIVRPAPGSVLASPAARFGQGEPDYFFHWVRDSAAVMEAVRILAGAERPAGAWIGRFNEFVRFSLDLRRIDGKRFLETSDFRIRTEPYFQQFLRRDDDIAAVEGARVAGDVRYNADGTLDFILWNRPQHDGPAHRALLAMRFEESGLVPGEEANACLAQLINNDLSYTAANAGQPCFDIWEEDNAQHYYTVLAQFAALEKGAARAERAGSAVLGADLRAKAAGLRDLLDSFWSPELGIYRSRLPGPEGDGPKALDFAVILGVLHAGLESGPHSVEDERVERTMAKLEELFAADYAINRSRADGIMFGRYKGDSYVSGGAYYFSTFGAAEYYYRRARADPKRREALIAKGDAILSRVRDFIPSRGDLTEQFDQLSGAQTSAKDLSWSYACFITARHARQLALGLEDCA